MKWRFSRGLADCTSVCVALFTRFFASFEFIGNGQPCHLLFGGNRGLCRKPWVAIRCLDGTTTYKYMQKKKKKKKKKRDEK